MAKISTYNNDGTIEAGDKLIGTDGSENTAETGKTKNYTISAIKQFILNNISGNVNLLDNARIRLGTDADLQIYHDPASDTPNSWIRDLGGGDLYLDTNGPEVQISNTGGTETMARFIKDGAVELYHNNSKKLETTSSGVSVTGLADYADDTAAAAGNVPVNGLYRTGSIIKIRVS